MPKYSQVRNDTPFGPHIINAKVGARENPSTFEVDGLMTAAESGERGDGVFASGGDGYSGGGGRGLCYGGSDGRDGVCIDGGMGVGSGTGEDLRNFTFESWTLTPGDGGVYFEESWHYYYGGGGGGVIVNGAGPEDDYGLQGQGYGGGGNGYYKFDDGKQGVILLEIESASD